MEARISGEVRGQLAVGNNIVQNNVSHGGVVYVAAGGQVPTVTPRPLPVELRGRRGPELVGRTAELEQTATALEAGGPAEIYGIAGLGKTALLKQVVHQAPAESPFDGVVYHQAPAEPAEDILQFLFEAFYSSDVPVKATPAELRHGLGGIHALVALDEVDLGRQQLGQVLDALPEARFLLASPRRLLWGEGHSLGLRGLPVETSLALLERELGRPLTRERPAAMAICTAVEGRPLQLLQVAALVSHLSCSLTTLARRMRSAERVDELAEVLFESLSDDQRDVLGLLAAVDGATLRPEHLADLTGVADIASVVESLMLLALVEAHSPRYSLTMELGNEPRRALRASAWQERAVLGLAEWIEGHDDTHQVLDEVAAILRTLERGAAERAWSAVLRLGRAVESALILGRRWGAWESVLRHELRAARATREQPAEAWALHQLGTRALCLEEVSSARSLLSQALALRESLGDTEGAAATRHNLELLAGPPPPPRPPREPPPGRPPTPATGLAPPAPPASPLTKVAAAAAAVLLLLGLAAAAFRSVQVDGVGERGVRSISVGPGDERGIDSLDFGQQPLGAPSTVRTARMVNGDDRPLLIEGVTLTGASPGDYLIGTDGCSGTALEPAGNCTIDVRFRPREVGERPATLTIARAGSSPLEVGLLGVGVAASLVAEPLTIDLGQVASGAQSAAASATISNRGEATAKIDDVAITGIDAGQFALLAQRCSALAPGASCTIDVAFRPSGAGARRASLEVRSGERLLGVALVGDATPVEPAPTPELSITVSPTTLAFGEQAVATSSASRQINLHNQGTRAVTLGRTTVVGAHPGDFAIERDGCQGTSLAPQGSCTVAVSFEPTEAGTRQAVLGIRPDRGADGLSVALSGVGSPVADLQVEVSFQDDNETVTITVTNNGPSTATDVVLQGIGEAGIFSVSGDDGFDCSRPVEEEDLLGGINASSSTFGQLRCELASLAAGDMASVDIGRTCGEPIAVVEGHEMDPESGNNRASAGYSCGGID